MYISINDLITTINMLRSECGENKEYDRALSEVFDYLVPSDFEITNPMKVLNLYEIVTTKGDSLFVKASDEEVVLMAISGTNAESYGEISILSDVLPKHDFILPNQTKELQKFLLG